MEIEKAYPFTPQLLSWIRENGKEGVSWLRKSAAFDFTGDPDEVVCVQMSKRGVDKGLVINKIGVRSKFRRQGETTRLIKTVEETAKEIGLKYIYIQSVLNEPMEKLCLKLGYTLIPESDYIKQL